MPHPPVRFHRVRRRARRPLGVRPAFGLIPAFIIGLALAGCGSDVTGPAEGNSPLPPFLVGETEGPGVAVSTPYPNPLPFRVVSQGGAEVTAEVELDLDDNGEIDLVITRRRILEDGRQLVTATARPGTGIAVAPGEQTPVPAGFAMSPATLRAPRVPPPGTILERDALVWAEVEPVFIAYVIRNTMFAPSGFRLLGQSNHLVFRIGGRLGWVELAVNAGGDLQVESVDVRRVGLRVDPRDE